MTRTTNKIGVDAICQGLLDGGCQATYNYPGFFSHDVFNALGGKITSLNERVAYAEAFGSSLAGKRTAVSFKNVGLNIASDAFLHSVISGVRAGIVLVVTDDVSVWGSQESQDSRSYFDFFGGLWLEPCTLQEAYDFGRSAFELSEKYDTPVVIRLTNPYFELDDTIIRVKETSKKPASYKPVASSKFVVHPVYFAEQHKNLLRKNEVIRQAYDVQKSPNPAPSHKKGVVTIGAVETKLTIVEEADIFCISHYPLPLTALKDFIDSHDAIEVVEHGSPYVSRQLRQLQAQNSIHSTLPTVLGQKRHFTRWTRYQNFFDALVSIQPDMVFSDVTQFTVEENDSVKASLSLGVAVSSTIGYAEADPLQYAYCLSGDSSILHEGIGIFDEALRRNVAMGVVIFDNGGAWCTGGQECAGDIYHTPNDARIKTHTINLGSTSQHDLTASLIAMRQFEGISILYITVPMGNFNRG